jgi:heme A synthase
MAALAALATWVLIAVGGYVRVTESGMGCPDWPKCHGQWLPPDSVAAIIEVTHRYAAAAVSLLVAGALVFAFRSRRALPGAWRAVLLATALIVFQIGLGAWTVMTGNRGDTVVAHLVTAFLTLGALTWAALPAVPGRIWRPALGLAASTLVLAAVGAVVQVTAGGYLCPEFPFCGAVWPTDRGTAAEVHMLHRALALATGVLLAFLLARLARVREPRLVWRIALVASVLFVLQAALGIAQVTSGMPAGLRWAHLAVGAAFWACTVAIAAGFRAPPVDRAIEPGVRAA